MEWTVLCGGPYSSFEALPAIRTKLNSRSFCLGLVRLHPRIVESYEEKDQYPPRISTYYVKVIIPLAGEGPRSGGEGIVATRAIPHACYSRAMPPGLSKLKEVRHLDIREGD